MTLKSNPRRDLIWQELHARPYIGFVAPAHVFHFAFLNHAETDTADTADLARLMETLGLQRTFAGARHAIYAGAIAGLGRLAVVWEWHGDFVAYTFFLHQMQIPFVPFGLEYSAFLPGGFPESIDTPLVATRLAIGSRSDFPDSADGLAALFEGQTLTGSLVMGGRAEVWNCFRAHADGLGRIAVIVNDVSAEDLGRTVERVVAIEDSYHLMLLSLPLARKLKFQLLQWETRIVQHMESLRSADSLQSKRAVLDSFLTMAADVENMRAQIVHPFTRAASHFRMLKTRIRELREKKIEHVFRLSGFLMRRLAPAAQTHRSVLRRLALVSRRIDRGADLLRTSIDLVVEEQNQRLLENVDRRARVELELQHALEGLSVVVVTVYTLELISDVLKGAHDIGFKIHPDIVLGAAAPILLIAFWGVMRFIRRRIEGPR
jgi:uncharacterized membrane-anchored protein